MAGSWQDAYVALVFWQYTSRPHALTNAPARPHSRALVLTMGAEETPRFPFKGSLEGIWGHVRAVLEECSGFDDSF